MKRRQALAGLAALAGYAALSPARAQAPRKPRRVVILQFGAPGNFKSRAEAFRKAMKDLGYAEGKDVAYEWPSANGQHELLGSAVPRLARVAGLVNPPNTSYRAYCERLGVSAQKAGAKLVIVDAANSQQADRAFPGGKNRVDGLVVMSDALFYTERKQIVELADANRLPVIYPLRGYVEVADMSYATVSPNATQEALYRVYRRLSADSQPFGFASH